LQHFKTYVSVSHGSATRFLASNEIYYIFIL